MYENAITDWWWRRHGSASLFRLCFWLLPSIHLPDRVLLSPLHLSHDRSPVDKISIPGSECHGYCNSSRKTFQQIVEHDENWMLATQLTHTIIPKTWKYVFGRIFTGWTVFFGRLKAWLVMASKAIVFCETLTTWLIRGTRYFWRASFSVASRMKISAPIGLTVVKQGRPNFPHIPADKTIDMASTPESTQTTPTSGRLCQREAPEVSLDLTCFNYTCP